MTQFNLQPISNADLNGMGRRSGIRVTLDKQRRLGLSADFRKKLGVFAISGTPIYVAVDPAQMVIAIVRQDVTRTVANAASMRISKDGYVYGRAIFEKLALNHEEGPYRFEYMGPIDHDGTRWDGFRLTEG